MVILVSALLEAVVDHDARWPGLGVFSVVQSRRMPGFPRHKRLRFRMSPHLFRAMNGGRPPPGEPVDGAVDWIHDPTTADTAIAIVEDSLRRRGSALVAGLGTLVVERRELDDVIQFFVVLRTAPEALRLLNPSDDAYEAALTAEYPDGPPTSEGTVEA